MANLLEFLGESDGLIGLLSAVLGVLAAWLGRQKQVTVRIEQAGAKDVHVPNSSQSGPLPSGTTADGKADRSNMPLALKFYAAIYVLFNVSVLVLPFLTERSGWMLVAAVVTWLCFIVTAPLVAFVPLGVFYDLITKDYNLSFRQVVVWLGINSLLLLATVGSYAHLAGRWYG